MVGMRRGTYKSACGNHGLQTNMLNAKFPWDNVCFRVAWQAWDKASSVARLTGSQIATHSNMSLNAKSPNGATQPSK